MMYKLLVLLSILWLVLGKKTKDEAIEIPITEEMKRALLERNPKLFGDANHPQKATCRCKLETIDLGAQRLKWFTEPDHPKWAEFKLSRGASFGPELYDETKGIVSWVVLEEFQLFLEKDFQIVLTLGDLLTLVKPVAPPKRKTASTPATRSSRNDADEAVLCEPQ